MKTLLVWIILVCQLCLPLFFGCVQTPTTEEHCLKCTETFYRDEVIGNLQGGGYLYKTVFKSEHTSIECTDTYVGPYKINGQADNPKDGKDFDWSYKECVEQ